MQFVRIILQLYLKLLLYICFCSIKKAYVSRGTDMAKIIRIKDDTVSVGMDDGSFFDMKQEDIDFHPAVGDEVNVFTSGNRTIISKINRPVATKNNFVYQEGLVSGIIVNQIVYVLLAIFLGTFGAHKFYAGQIGKGIIYLIFCWTFIPGLIGLIEGITAISKKPDSEGNIVL